MADQFRNYLELQQVYRERIDYQIAAVARSQPLIILGIHAGGIELGTSELARAIAGSDFSLYLFEGWASNNQALHITSTCFDEPQCLELVKRHTTSLSLHGFSETAPLIELGGNDLVLREHLLNALNRNGYHARINTGKYAATDPANVCNRTGSGKGVQMEISSGLRSQFFADYLTRIGRRTTTPAFNHFVQTVRSALQTLALGM